MTPEEAVKYFNDEIWLCRAAPSINGCQMTEDWQRTIDACEIAVASIRKVPELEQEVCRLKSRLAAYEDTGLEPRDIISAVDMAKIACALHELNAYKDIGPIDHLRGLHQAEQDGRLVVLPQKTVWELTLDAGPDCDMKCPVDAWDESLGCDLCSKAKLFAYERPCTQDLLKGLGKTVFLTREEAEAALKGGEG